LTQARGLLAFLSSSVSTENSPYGLLLKQELEAISRYDDYYLHHEHLEEVNSPLYFHQFAERAAQAGLQYLGEADFGVMSLDGFPDHVRAMLQSVSRDLIETEQYMDFLRNRVFRQTLLCRKEASIDRGLPLAQILKLRVASDTVPEAQPVDMNPSAKVAFRRRSSMLNTTNPLVKAALLYLNSIWPQSVPFVELASLARSAVSNQPTMVDADVLGPASRQLAETLIRCYSTAHVDLRTFEPGAAATIPEKPRAAALARRQAATTTSVTNYLHETVHLDDFQRHLLTLLDGRRNQTELSEALAALIVQGELVVFDAQRRITNLDDARRIARESVPQALQHLARLALIAAS
jgi:methyltransferase-like protein